MAEIEGTTTTLKERQRRYIFADREIVLDEVIELTVRPSGSHRVKTSDGRLHVIATNWLAITITDESHDWTV